MMCSFCCSTRPAFSVRKSAEEMFDVENSMITATFSACTGTMQYIMRKSDDLGHKVGLKFMTYSTGSWSNPFKDKSGAYIFMPDGPAKNMEVKYPNMIVVKGVVATSVYTYLPGVVHVTTLYNVTGPVGAGIHVDNTVDLNKDSWNNKELVMRLVSDLDNPNSDVCVDLNGFQMTRKQWRAKQLIQGNFHPVNTMAYIQDNRRSRLTLVMAQAHGLASLNFGWLEVVLDRRLMQDDWRGLGEGVSDNTATPSKFVILLEHRDKPLIKTKLPSTHCRPSLLAEMTSEHLNNPPVVTLSHLEISTLADHGFHPLLETSMPCSLNLVNLKTVEFGADQSSVKALMVLQHAGVDCDFSEVHMQCGMQSKLQTKLFKATRVWTAIEMSLTATQVKNPTAVRELEIPEMELRTYKFTFS
ncbi:hypothetical protein V1264_018894 [Littorina saxatilis]|uniref:Glycosyl hydrolase family 38 C-terminal domain-containing protein n=1 Tax=Littorina saxatilis TaxID=31220 RepID=A0AAN9BFC0_9CAEN